MATFSTNPRPPDTLCRFCIKLTNDALGLLLKVNIGIPQLTSYENDAKFPGRDLQAYDSVVQPKSGMLREWMPLVEVEDSLRSNEITRNFPQNTRRVEERCSEAYRVDMQTPTCVHDLVLTLSMLVWSVEH